MTSIYTKLVVALAGALTMVSFTAVADVSCESQNSRISATTPASQFTINDDGTAVHNTTNLMWSRCPVGQNVGPGDRCLGTAELFHWRGALNHVQQSEFAGYDDWRLPNIKELESIIERQCQNPSLNTQVFEVPSHWNYWSATPAQNRALRMNVSDGIPSAGIRTTGTSGIYLVRDIR